MTARKEITSTSDEPPRSPMAELPLKKIRGIGVSEGIAAGKAFVLDRERIIIPHRSLPARQVKAELARFHQALKKAKQGLRQIKKALRAAKSREPLFILDAHLMMLEDEMLVKGTEELIRQNQINAEWALRLKTAELMNIFQKMTDPYLKERGRDVEQVVERVIAELVGKTDDPLSLLEEPVIVVAHDLTPAETARLALDKVLGFATDIGSATSHTAIVAKSLRIPAVVGCTTVTSQVLPDTPLLLDGHAGIVIINPTPEIQEEYESQKKWLADFRTVVQEVQHLPSKTKDGHKITLAANLEIIEELAFLAESGAEGVGLFRTEYLYLERDALPDEEEHYESYKKLVQAVHPHGAVIRTLDLGGDKFKSTLSLADELNPAMGLRAIRLCLAQPEIFKTQLRAILRASVHGKTAVMFPMISSYREFLQAKTFLLQTANELEREGIPFNRHLEIGAMIEVPSAAIAAEDLAEEADFFSIGTNDLIQYTLAIDRGNEHVNYLYEPLHPSILRLLRWIVSAGHAKGIPVHMCGAMAADPLLLPVLIGLDLDELSMPASMILRIKRLLRGIAKTDAAALVEELLSLKTAAEIKERLRKEIETRWADVYALERKAFEHENALASP